jgi:hypothetical protein
MKWIIFSSLNLLLALSASAAEIPSNCQKAAELACEKAIVNEDCVNRMVSACHRITMVPAVKDPAYSRAVELTRLLCQNSDFNAQMECMSKTYPEVARDLLI